MDKGRSGCKRGFEGGGVVIQMEGKEDETCVQKGEKLRLR